MRKIKIITLVSLLYVLVIVSCKKDSSNNNQYSGAYTGLLSDGSTGSGSINDTIIVSKGSSSSTINILDKNTGSTIVATLGANVTTGSGTTASLTITNQLITVGTSTLTYSGTGAVVTTTGSIVSVTFTLTSSGGIIFTFSGTGNPTGPTGPTGASGLLKSETSIVISGGVSDTVINTFTYDNQNRVSTQIGTTKAGSSSSGSDTITYTYYSDSIVQNAVGLYSVTYYLNSQGYRTSDNLGDTWTYNTGGYLVSATKASSSDAYTYNSSNQLATQTNTSSGVTTTDTYSYSANPISSAGTSWQMGKSTGALWSTDVNVQSGVTKTLSFTYVLNSQNLLGEETVNSTAPGSTAVVTYFAYY